MKFFILSFVWFSGLWILGAYVQHLWRSRRQNVSKRRHKTFRRQGITQKKEYNIQNMAKVRNQEYMKLLQILKEAFQFILSFNRHYNPSWVSACSTVVEHSQQEGFTECRCQWHLKPPTWRRIRDLGRSIFRHKRPPASDATLTKPTAEGGTVGEKMAEKFCRKWRLPRHFWVLLHAVKHDVGQTALLPLRRKVCWGFFSP
jgi:hypothetical protein